MRIFFWDPIRIIVHLYNNIKLEVCVFVCLKYINFKYKITDPNSLINIVVCLQCTLTSRALRGAAKIFTI